MQFKSFVFLLTLSLFLNGCTSKENEQNSNKNEINKEKIEKRTDFTLTTTKNEQINIKIENNTIKIENEPKKIILLNFFATWCPPCKAEIPNLIKLQKDYKNDFKIISILLENGKTNEDLQEFIKEYNINYTITNSNENYELSNALGKINSIPTMFIVGKDSKIFQKYVGLVPVEMMEIDIKKLLSK